MTTEKLSQAVQLIKSGNKIDALPILKEVVQTEPNNENAWLWLYSCVENVEQKRYCLQQVLKINPNNQGAQKWLAAFKAEEAKTVNTVQQELPDKTEAKQNMKNNRMFIILAGMFGLVVLCGVSILGLWILNRQGILSFPSISGITRPTDSECQKSYDAIVSETEANDGEIMDFLLNNNQAPDTVGFIAKKCISDGWKPAPSVVTNRCFQVWFKMGLGNGLSISEISSTSFFQNWVNNPNNKHHPNWDYLNKCLSSGALRQLPDP
jgi:hypothetical protein